MCEVLCLHKKVDSEFLNSDRNLLFCSSNQCNSFISSTIFDMQYGERGGTGPRIVFFENSVQDTREPLNVVALFKKKIE